MSIEHGEVDDNFYYVLPDNVEHALIGAMLMTLAYLAYDGEALIMKRNDDGRVVLNVTYGSLGAAMLKYKVKVAHKGAGVTMELVDK